MLASTFMDMVLGVDIHFEMVPMPAPVPTPIPNPFVGMVFDPAGLLVGQVMSLTMAMLSGTPPLGPVLINGFPATTVGTNAINTLGVPHILIPPGTAWAPMPKLPKPSFKGKPPAPGPPVAPGGRRDQRLRVADGEPDGRQRRAHGRQVDELRRAGAPAVVDGARDPQGHAGDDRRAAGDLDHGRDRGAGALEVGRRATCTIC